MGTASAVVSTGSLGSGSTSANCTWTINAQSTNVVNETMVYWTVTIFDTQGYMYTTQSTTTHGSGITSSGVSGVSRSIAIYGVNITQQSGSPDSPGTINTMRPAYQQNETVSLIAMPSQNFIFNGKPVVSGINAGNITQTDNNFTFTMPAADVTVSTNSTNKFFCTDATLKDLELTEYTVAGYEFFKYTTNYTVNTSTIAILSTTVTPTKTNPYSSITVNGTSTPSGIGRDITTNIGRNTIEVVVTPEFGSAVTYTISVNRRPGQPAITSAYASGNGFLSTVNLSSSVSGADFYEAYYDTNINTIDYATPPNTVNTILGTSGSIGATGSLPEGPVYVWIRAKKDDVVGQWSAPQQYYVGVAFDHNMLSGIDTRTRYIAPGTYPIASGHVSTVSGTKTLVPVGDVTLQRQSTYLTEIFSVGNDATLNLGQASPINNGKLTIDGGAVGTAPTLAGVTNATRAAIIVNGGSCNIYTGVTIQNNYNSHASGNEGLGGGIAILAGSVSLQEGGKIINNTAAGSGGGIGVFSVNGAAEFTINGSQATIISGNYAGNNGGGIFLYGTSVYKVTVNWNGGKVSGNTGTSNKTGGNGVFKQGGDSTDLVIEYGSGTDFE
jgi:hypothetical protein